MRYRVDIQGLRAVAFLLVFIFHLNKDWLPGGFIGVDIFFVISGFLITTIVLNDISKGSFSIFSFYAKRIKRLFPAYLVMVFFTAIICGCFYLYADIFNLRKWTLSALVFLSNFVFAKEDSYFGVKGAENPLLHTWSLAVEMQFYIFLPLVLLYIRRKFLTYFFVAIAIILSSIVTYVLFDTNNEAIYYSLFSRIPEFFVGCFFSIINQNINKNRLYLKILNYFAVFLIAVFSFLYNDSYLFPGFIALIPCIATGIILISDEKSFLNKLLSNRAVVYVGILSYSLYLWHWPIMAFVRYVNDKYYFNLTELNIRKIA